MKTLLKATICAVLALISGSIFAQPQYKPYYRTHRIASFDSLFSRMTDYGWLFLKDSPSSRIVPDSFVVRYATNLGLSEGYNLKLTKEETETPEGSTTSMRHQLFQVHYKNIPVEGNEFSLHSAENVLKVAHGKIVAGLDIDVNGGISAEIALQTALNEQRLAQDSFDGNVLPTGSLILARKDEDFLKESYRLAWVFDLKSEKINKPYRVYVDARTGSILKKVPLFMNCFAPHQQQPGTEAPKAGLIPLRPLVASIMTPNYSRYLNGQPNITFETEQVGGQYRLSAYNNQLNTRIATLPGDPSFSWSSCPDVTNPTSNWSNANRNATTAHWLAQKMHDMSWLLFLRNGYNGNGAYPKVVVIEANDPGASWNGSQVQFGRSAGGSSLVTMDVFGHEYGHAITGTSAKLVYQGESGALNESISDILGTTLEYHLLGPNANYDLGEDAETIRSMSNPGLYGHPDIYQGPNWFPTNNPFDQGGVHINSGVMNKWYWYMRTGGPTGTPLDYAKPAKVVYRAMQFYLHANSTYYDAAEATIQGAIDTYGSCSDIARQAAYAWTQVGISHVTPCTDCNFVITTSASPATPACGAQVTLNANCSGSGCSHINSYQWTGNSIVQNGKSVTINAPAAPGSYTYHVSTVKNGCLLNVAPLNMTTQNGGGGFNACLESENANGNGPVSSDPNASNGQTRGAENNNNHYVDYTITGVPSNGVYAIKLRYYSSSAPVVSVSANGGGGQTVNLANSGSWNIVWTEQSFNLNLNAGTNTIKIQGIGGGSCRQDKICVTGGGCNPPNPPSVSANPSTINAGASSTLSASNCNGTITWSNGLGNNSSVNVAPGSTTTYYATCTFNGCASSQAAVMVTVNGSVNFSQCKESESSAGNGTITSDPNASNGQTRGEENNGNHYVDYAITGVPAAGTYFVKLRYYSSAAPSVTVQVNGGNTQTVNLPNSGSWNIVWAEQTISVNLAAGNNTIRIQGAGGGSCRQDRVCVSSNANARVNVETQDTISETDLFLFPNPNAGQFEVSFYLENGEKAELAVLDMQGHKHFRQLVSGQGIHRRKLSLSHIPSGTYLVQVKTTSGSRVTRTVILK